MPCQYIPLYLGIILLMEKNMNSSMKLLLVGAVLALGLSASASQATTLDVVRDSNGTPVRTKDGACVRSTGKATQIIAKALKLLPLTQYRLHTEHG